MVAPEIAAAGVSALGNLLGSGTSAFGSNATNRKAQAFAEQQQEKQYVYQRLLNEQSLALSKDYTHWLNTQGYGMMRQGLESAGYNPILAVNSSPQFGSIGGGSATAGPSANLQNPFSGFGDLGSKLSDGVNSAYKTFKLERELQEADLKIKNKQQEFLESQIRNLDKQTSNLDVDKLLKLANIDLYKGQTSNLPYIAQQIMAQTSNLEASTGKLGAETTNVEKATDLMKFKGILSTLGSIAQDINTGDYKAKDDTSSKLIKAVIQRGFWNYYDYVNDVASYIKGHSTGTHLPFRYYRGLSKDVRIRHNVTNVKQLKFKPRIN